ncbi:uroporphyrinogen decarboxylase family protein [Geosporobacter ferrireducens]|uniref:uroporphyrinogen decarboxylase family protein n=1 Tax=Geosporobacter ferrireducens TaxID=1424294 RepID=UPI00139D60DD|nr:uroporphyrinogen decarboxylase family protein [Geosporobacter ferrireducens]MTI58078.1 hypothetical protein [Geosporobacter ferrireducens]
MTGRERILSTISGEIPDRVPVSFFLQEEFLSYYYPDKDKVDRVKDAVACGIELGLDIMPRGREFEHPHFMKKSFLNWDLNHKYQRDGNNILHITEITTPKGILKQVEVGPYNEKTGAGVHMATHEYLIKDERDFEIFSQYVPAIDQETITAMKAYGEYIQKLLGEQGMASPWGWSGVFNQVAGYRDVQNLLMDAYINRDFYEAYMEKLTELMVEYNRALADTALDCIGLQGNIANSAMVGDQFFNEYILPYEKRLVSAIKENGTYTLYHNCGKAKILQESYVEMGLDVWETVAEAPVGDNTLREAKKLVGNRITLAGNLDQVNFLKQASLAEVERSVVDMMAIGKPGGRYIFAASDFLEKNTPIENIKKAIEVAIREGKYE